MEGSNAFVSGLPESMGGGPENKTRPVSKLESLLKLMFVEKNLDTQMLFAELTKK